MGAFFKRMAPAAPRSLASLPNQRKNGIVKAVYMEGGAYLIPLIILAIKDDGDREFMITVYTELHPLMKSTAFQIVNDNGIAEDIIQDTVIELIENLKMIRGYELKRLVSYIKSVTKNNSLDYCRKKKLESKHTQYTFDDDSVTTIPDDSVSSVERLEISEEYEILGRVMKLLPERERDLLYLKYGLQYDDEVIGNLMGIKKDSVRQYLTRARRQAKEYFTKGDDIS
jgi:RNA polymerase sigma-70 factor (ECF subfamily)